MAIQVPYITSIISQDEVKPMQILNALHVPCRVREDKKIKRAGNLKKETIRDKARMTFLVPLNMC